MAKAASERRPSLHQAWRKRSCSSRGFGTVARIAHRARRAVMKILASYLTAKIKELLTRRPKIVQLFDDGILGTLALDAKGRIWELRFGNGAYWVHRPTRFIRKRGQR